MPEAICPSGLGYYFFRMEWDFALRHLSRNEESRQDENELLESRCLKIDVHKTCCGRYPGNERGIDAR